MGHYARVGPVRGVDFGSYDSRDERGAFHLSFVSRSRLLVFLVFFVGVCLSSFGFGLVFWAVLLLFWFDQGSDPSP